MAAKDQSKNEFPRNSRGSGLKFENQFSLFDWLTLISLPSFSGSMVSTTSPFSMRDSVFSASHGSTTLNCATNYPNLPCFFRPHHLQLAGAAEGQLLGRGGSPQLLLGADDLHLLRPSTVRAAVSSLPNLHNSNSKNSFPALAWAGPSQSIAWLY